MTEKIRQWELYAGLGAPKVRNEFNLLEVNLDMQNFNTYFM
jgi:hypothetical protein